MSNDIVDLKNYKMSANEEWCGEWVCHNQYKDATEVREDQV